MTAQVAADLRAAAEVLRRDGWTQGSYWDPETGCHCVLGAMAYALTDGRRHEIHDLATPEFLRSNAMIVLLYRLNVGVRQHEGVDGWNDAPGRTADEVIAALEAAADAAEAQQ